MLFDRKSRRKGIKVYQIKLLSENLREFLEKRRNRCYRAIELD